MTEGVFPKVDGDVLYASEVNGFSYVTKETLTEDTTTYTLTANGSSSTDWTTQSTYTLTVPSNKTLVAIGFNYDIASNQNSENYNTSRLAYVRGRIIKEGPNQFDSITIASDVSVIFDSMDVTITNPFVSKAKIIKISRPTAIDSTVSVAIDMAMVDHVGGQDGDIQIKNITIVGYYADYSNSP